MDLIEAQKVLDGCVRHVIFDRYSGATEVAWDDGGGVNITATGWYAGSDRSVSFDATGARFTGDDADALRYRGGNVQHHPLQPPEEEQEYESLKRLAAQVRPLDPCTLGGFMID